MASSSSSSAIKPTSISLLFFLFIFSLSISSSSIASSNQHPLHPSCSPSPSPSPSSSTPKPTPWPLQFHSLLIVNTTTSKHEIIDLWYDWPKGRNFNIIQKQYGELLYDLEWTNGTSFYYTLDSNKTCRKKLFPVGILPPNWLKGATYVGQRKVDGFLCNVWEKAEFIRYFEDVVTKRPVHWQFIKSVRGIHVMTFEVGRVLEDAKWQAPVYCFNKNNTTATTTTTTTTQVVSEGDDDDDIEHGSTSTSSDEFNGGGIFEWFRKAALDN